MRFNMVPQEGLEPPRLLPAADFESAMSAIPSLGQLKEIWVNMYRIRTYPTRPDCMYSCLQALSKYLGAGVPANTPHNLC